MKHTNKTRGKKAASSVGCALASLTFGGGNKKKDKVLGGKSGGKGGPGGAGKEGATKVKAGGVSKNKKK